MSKEEIRSIKVEMSKESWKRIKILSIQNELSMTEQVKVILENSVKNKKYNKLEEEQQN